MKLVSGRLLIATGVIHSMVGIAVGAGATAELGGRNLFAEVARDGVVGAIEPDPFRMVMFWFLFFGLAVIILGDLVAGLERRGIAPPARLGWQLGALGLAGGLMIPVSGFWLVLPQAWWIIHRATSSGHSTTSTSAGAPATPRTAPTVAMSR